MTDHGPYSPYQQAPKYPELPRHRETTRWLHGLLTIVTGGMWALVWIPLAIAANAANSADKRRYQRECAAWRQYQIGLLR
jgi:hypothetical protein